MDDLDATIEYIKHLPPDKLRWVLLILSHMCK